jgi:hypothetical protein
MAQVVAKTGKFLSDNGLLAVLDDGMGLSGVVSRDGPALERFYRPGRQIDSFARDSAGMSGLTELIRDVGDHPDH